MRVLRLHLKLDTSTLLKSSVRLRSAGSEVGAAWQVEKQNTRLPKTVPSPNPNG